jgi:serine/threonine protein kinase
VKVGDFGLAKIVHSDRSETLRGPQSRGIVGTPEYMAPEQMEEGVGLDARADIYALGAIAYHMLGGRPPFTGELTQLIAQKLLQLPQPLTALRSDISSELEEAVMRALAKEPKERPANAGDWLTEFEAAITAPAPRPVPESRVVILAPAGSEVYLDDERRGSVGRSGRVVLTSIAPGQHVLRVARIGDSDDERVIEIRHDTAEQIIQAQFKNAPSSEPLSPSRGGSLDSRTGVEPPALGVVFCTKCHSRFAEGTKFCGRCGNTTFQSVGPTTPLANTALSVSRGPDRIVCPRCGQEYPVGTRFCGRCGIPLGTSPLDWKPPRPVEVVCKHCGASYAPMTRFCGRCGKPINP